MPRVSLLYVGETLALHLLRELETLMNKVVQAVLAKHAHGRFLHCEVFTCITVI